MGSFILLILVVFIRYMAQDYAKRPLAVNPVSKGIPAVNVHEREAQKSSQVHLGRSHSLRTQAMNINPCERGPSIEMAQLMEADLKNDQVYEKKLIGLFDHLDRSVDDYMNFFAEGGQEKDINCVPMRDEISKIDYMISQRDRYDSKIKNIILTRYKAIAYRILDQTMGTKREYYSMVAISGIFMNVSGKHFFSIEIEKELSYIHERIRDDYKSFRFQKEQKETIDKNGMADRILLRDWLGSLL